jgi:hypothetical protein
MYSSGATLPSRRIALRPWKIWSRSPNGARARAHYRLSMSPRLADEVEVTYRFTLARAHSR